MSTQTTPAAGGGQLKETERVQAPVGGPGRGGPFGGGMVGQKASTFGPSAKRMIGRLAPERTKTIGVVALAVVSVGLTAVGPRILGKATDLIFAGLIGGPLPAGASKAEVVASLRAQGKDKFADMVASMDHLVPGQGVDFDAVGRVLLRETGGGRLAVAVQHGGPFPVRPWRVREDGRGVRPAQPVRLQVERRQDR